VALAVVAVAGGIVAIGIAVRADQAAPGPPPTAGHAAGAPGTSPPVTTVLPGADRASADWPVFGYDAARREQTLGIVGLVAGSLMAIGGVTFLVLPRSEPTGAPVGATFAVTGRF